MTAKNRIILSVIAIITTLVVAGSMVFIIFAATRGSIGGGVTIEYGANYQIEGTVTTRYTTSPISKFGNGEGDIIVKTTDGADYVQFKGWQDQEGISKGLELVEVELTAEHPWIIFQIDVSLNYTNNVWVSLEHNTTYENVIITGYFGRMPDNISPDAFEKLYNGDLSDSGAITTSGLWGCTSPIWCVIQVADKTKNASFSGGISVSFSLEYS